MRSAARRCIPMLLLTCVAAMSVVDAQSYTIVESVRLPAESFVGDPIELRYRVRSALELEAPARLPVPTWGDITSVRVIERGDEYDVRLVVVPFEPGTLTVPPIDLGGVALDGLSFVVSSVGEDRTEVRGILGPERLPGTRLVMLIVVLAVALPLLALLYFAGPGRAVVRRILARRQARLPYRKLLRTIDQLEKNIRYDSARDFYTLLVSALQDLMTSRLGFECRAATSTELTSYLPALAAQCGADAQAADPLAGIFETSDSAKFAGAQIRRKVRLEQLRTCRALMVELESLRRRRRRLQRSRTGRREVADAGV